MTLCLFTVPPVINDAGDEPDQPENDDLSVNQEFNTNLETCSTICLEEDSYQCCLSDQEYDSDPNNVVTESEVESEDEGIF